MAYFCNYETYPLKGLKETNYNSACFGSIYKRQESMKRAIVYVLKDYSGYYGNELVFTKEEMFEYSGYLNKAGFKHTLTEGELQEKPAYLFEINIKENAPIINLILINMIRHTYENEADTNVSKYFLKLGRLEGETHYYNRFVISYMSVDPDIHNVATLYHVIALLNDEELKKLFESTSYVTVAGPNIPRWKEPKGFHEITNEIKLMMDNKVSIDLIEKKYRETCEKSMS